MYINYLTRISEQQLMADKSAVCAINRHLRISDPLVNQHYLVRWRESLRLKVM